MAISAGLRNTICVLESGALITATTGGNFKQERYTHGANTVVIMRDKNDGDGKKKAKCVKKAVETISKKGFAIPNNLMVYCVAVPAAQNRSYNRDSNFNQISVITLGITALQNGRPDATSAQHALYPGFSKGDITTIHEIGHCIHAANRGDAFFDPASGLGKAPNNAASVRGYAGTNRTEFDE